MTFTPDIPKVGQSLGNSRPQVLNNFAVLRSTLGGDTALGQTGDHYDVNKPILAGRHYWSRYVDQGGVPPAMMAGQSALYSRTLLGSSNIFFTNEVTGNEYILTRANDDGFAEGKFGANISYGTFPSGFTQVGGFSFLPGGLYIQWGFYGKAGATGGSGTIPFPVPFSTPYFSVQLTYKFGSGNLTLAGVPTATSFNFLSSTNSADGFYWIAIGK